MALSVPACRPGPRRTRNIAEECIVAFQVLGIQDDVLACVWSLSNGKSLKKLLSGLLSTDLVFVLEPKHMS